MEGVQQQQRELHQWQRQLFKGSISPGEKQNIDTSYRGLVLLRFTAGQVCPLIIGDESFGLSITGPGEPPSFRGSDENEIFIDGFRVLLPPQAQEHYDFARLMILD